MSCCCASSCSISYHVHIYSFRRQELHCSQEDDHISQSFQPGRENRSLCYPPDFKLEVAYYAQRHSQYAASKVFTVARRRIFDWMQKMKKLKESCKRSTWKDAEKIQRNNTSGRSPLCLKVDQELYKWYCQKRRFGEKPKSSQVQTRAREMYQKAGYPGMKCSYGWFKRWSRRFGIQLRHSLDQDLLEWLLIQQDLNRTVTYRDLQKKGLTLASKEDKSFKASPGWAIR